MRVPQKLALSDNCTSCALRQEGDFCSLAPDPLRSFSDMGYLSLFPPGVVLMAEGQVPRGVFVLCSGRAKLSMATDDGKTVILQVAGPRQVLGLSAVVSGRPSPVTITTIEPCQIKFVAEKDFLQFVEHTNAVALSCGAALGREVHTAFQDVHELLLARSSTEKLARLLLSWTADQSSDREVRVQASFTHEEVAQMIGSSRETVTRLFSDMKKRELIRFEGSTLVIPDRVALQAIAA